MLYMSEKEILYNCRINGATRHYISVLADLNCCTVNVIEHILMNNGWRKSGTKYYPPSPIKTEIKPLPKDYFPDPSFEGSVLNSSVYCDIESESKRLRKTVVNGKLEKAIIKYFNENFKSGLTYLDIAEHFGCPMWFVTDVLYKNGVLETYIETESGTNNYLLHQVLQNLLNRRIPR